MKTTHLVRAPWAASRRRGRGLVWLTLVSLTLSTLAWAPQARAWLLHEHARIGKEGVKELPAADREILAAAWALARSAREAKDADGKARLCEQMSLEPYLYMPGAASFCVDLPALTGLSADHSCSPTDTLATLRSDFIVGVMQVAEITETQLRQAATREARRDVWHTQHIELQHADPEYLFRAQSNGAHFQVPIEASDLRNVDLQLTSYLGRVVAAGQGLNAIGLYLNYHAAALQAAQRAVSGCTLGARGALQCSTPPDKLATELLLVLAEEAFALHFLEDAFSSGHMLSPTGDDSLRMGTHDYYCEHGLLAQSWGYPRQCTRRPAGDAYVAHGDAFLDPNVDLPRAGTAVRLSLAGLAAALRPGTVIAGLAQLQPRPDLNACTESKLPSGLDAAVPMVVRQENDSCQPQEVAAVEKGAPMPQQAPAADSSLAIVGALQALPHPVVQPPGTGSYYKELGFFYAPSASFALRVDTRELAGMGQSSYFNRVPGRINVGMGVGFTAGGITNSSSDGVFWLSPNFNVDARPPDSVYGMRLGAGLSLHAPYYLIPGDLLPLAVVALFDTNAYLKLLIRGASGGALGLESKHRIGNSYLQVVAGRDVTFNYMPKAPMAGNRAFVSFAGKPGYWQFVLPVLQFTSLHVSDQHVGLDTMWQLGYDLTRYVDKEEGLQGGVQYKFYHGIFLSYGFQARRYTLSVREE